MYQINLEKEREKLDREITFFHLKRAKRIALRALKEARRRKEWFFIYYFTAQKYILNERFKEAKRYLEKALRLRPKDALSYNDKAICLAELGDYEDALSCFNEGIKKNKDCPTLFHNKGWFLNFLNRHKEALVCFHKALEFDPFRPESLYSLADSYFSLGKFKEAKKYFQKAAQAVRGKSSFVYREAKRRFKEILSLEKDT
ncbi:MAG: tetratricopeptide repeat protein [Candidatus Omnitrophica bacterium]|nr:tetratricopeptide repeat protein [Candidatus Omnitrophota bacterium]